jgi:hypothetical protein
MLYFRTHQQAVDILHNIVDMEARPPIIAKYLVADTTMLVIVSQMIMCPRLGDNLALVTFGCRMGVIKRTVGALCG